MKTTSVVALFLALPLACGQTREDAPQSPPAIGEKAADQVEKSTVVKVPARPAKLAPALRQASYRTTSLELADGSVLDAGDAMLMIDTASTPPRAWLQLSAQGHDRSVSGKLHLDFEQFVAGKSEAPLALAGPSVLYLRSGQAEPAPMPIIRLELERASAAGRRTRFLIRAFAPDDSVLATLQTQFDITCMTKSENPNGEVDPDSAPLEILSTDPTLSSEACRPFAALL